MSSNNRELSVEELAKVSGGAPNSKPQARVGGGGPMGMLNQIMQMVQAQQQ
jgi:bacteriocin-like protein